VKGFLGRRSDERGRLGLKARPAVVTGGGESRGWILRATLGASRLAGIRAEQIQDAVIDKRRAADPDTPVMAVKARGEEPRYPTG
jgi:hypothetical protein